MAEDGFDSLFATARALGEETRFRIYRDLCASGRPASVSDLAGRFDLHPNAVRQHLARLEQAGLVVSSLDRSPGAGRPRRLFEANPEPLELVVVHPPRSLKPLLAMLSQLAASLPTSRLREVGRAWGLAWAAERRRANGSAPRTRRTRLDQFALQLAEWGWQPASREERGVVRVTTERCLFHDVAPERDGRCCALEEGVLSGLVEATLDGHAREVRIEGCRLDLLL